MRLSSLLQACCLVFALPATADDTLATHTDCADPAPWKKLDELIAKHDGSVGGPDVRYLRDLRRFVCAQLEVGHMPMPEATALFDSEKDRIVKKWSRLATRDGIAF